MEEFLEEGPKVANQDFFGEVHPEVDLLGADVILKFAADWQKTWVVAPDDLVLDEPLLKGVRFLEGFCLFLQHLQEVLVDLLGNCVGLHRPGRPSVI